MATTSVNPAHPSITLRKMLPIISASTLGTAIEWYDFFLYGFLAATVFPQLFFPRLDPYTGVIAAFITNFIGFIARPLGGAFLAGSVIVLDASQPLLPPSCLWAVLPC